MKNKIVARYQDGRLLKGFTADFRPTKPLFHLSPTDAAADANTIEIVIAELKAVFFVKDLAGNPAYNPKLEFETGKPVTGRKVKVKFKDGETMIGTTTGYEPTRTGFFLVPADPNENNERVFVVLAATEDVGLL